ncbi:MAG: Hpt domain-containing protein [Deltaproteobacteria bacterium]|nr:Hpt domain-containing protein [Deltaproteobacteria bacterium]
MEKQVFNFEDALERADGDLEFLEQLLEVLESSSATYIEQIETAINNNNLTEAYRSAHSLKGALLNLGAEKAGELAKQTEIKLKSGNRDVNLEEVCQSIQEFIETARATIREKKA